MNRHEPADAVTPIALVWEVQEFRAAAANPASSADEIRRAYSRIVDHAGHVNPQAPGFERAGVALKEAVCAWLDCQTLRAH
jgi:hypothetical protein